MKNKNDIDKLYEKTFNDKSFELKDSYLADFESQLDAYNQTKTKKLILIVFFSSILIGVLFDFVLLPNTSIQTETNLSSKEQLKDTKSQKEIDNSTITNENTLNTIGEASTDTKVINEEVKSEKTINQEKNRKESHIESAITKKELNKSNNITVKTFANSSSETKKVNEEQKTTQTSKESKNSENKKEQIQTIEENIQEKSQKEQTSELKQENKNTEKTKPAIQQDVYIDDTIRRKVIIIDTIVKRDTVVITDTIRKKVHLLKKKK